MTDLIVLGAGSAGYSATLRATQLGLDVMLVEPGELGGTCLNRGCIPTKAWLHSAHVNRVVASAAAFGITAAAQAPDASAISAHAGRIVAQLRTGLSQLLKTSGARLVSGRGRLVAAGAVEVNGRLFEAGAVLVATGARPITLGLAVDGQRILTSEHALQLERLPHSAIIVGGGVIGVEFASMWADLGVEVTLLEAAGSLLPGTDVDLRRVLTRGLTARGVRVRTGQRLGAVWEAPGKVEVEVGDERLSAEVLLVAVGREPATDALGLAEAGVRLDRGYVQVDAELCSSVPGVYAGGDVVSGPQLAHRGYAHGQFIAELLAWRLGKLPTRPRLVPDAQIPAVVYSSPQVATVGARLDQAGPGARETVYHLAGNAKSLIARPGGERETGLVKVVTDAAGVVVGVHVVGENVAELITPAAMHVGWRAEPADVAGVVHPHPTVSESLAEAILGSAGRALHMRA
ncbi:FAD-dependent oxidoreductase [Tessaracoccus sp. OH4464_COT-324]|uniref:FAD-dependent oxidoreductase n=1 Tax=Tessaracoccus sp. OH4464_COT-324 TaxID=2491059 RepID=UPI000F62F449|nr:FAD-dependent oxidoreductase [Tessaracoccus sp. OH4464_COT-324]RRD45770.1 dihydrolipoyl dehydrogenase [Tessaracoccus sp. OH4464_COT-324]